MRGRERTLSLGVLWTVRVEEHRWAVDDGAHTAGLAGEARCTVLCTSDLL